MSGKLVLAIDTTTEFGSLALASDGVIIEETAIDSPDGYGHILFSRIEALLSHHNLSLSDIQIFAAAAGPGTFTGVRVGLAAAKGFAATLGKPAAGVSNLQALALLGQGERRAAVLDARRGEVYAALFNAEAQPLSREVVLPFATWIESFPPGETTFVSNDSALIDSTLDTSRFAASPRIHAGRSLAGAIARLAPAQAKDPALLDANYVRKADAELAWTDR